MDLVVTIPKELEPVMEYWQKSKGVDMAAWLTDIAVGNLKSEVDVGYKAEVVEKVTLDDRVKAVDWTAKATEVSAPVEAPGEVEPEEPIEGGLK